MLSSIFQDLPSFRDVFVYIRGFKFSGKKPGIGKLFNGECDSVDGKSGNIIAKNKRSKCRGGGGMALAMVQGW